MKAKSKTWLWVAIGGLGVILIVILALLIVNNQKQAELEKQLRQAEEEKQFCRDLDYDIESPPQLGLGYLDVTFSVCSSKNDDAILTITLKNGKKLKEDMRLSEGSCVMHQAHGVYYDDVSSIEVVSERCPNVKDLITNIEEIK